MTTTFEDANELVRAAVAMRREAQAAGKPHEEWYDVSQPVTEPRNIVASTEDSQHVEWTGHDEDALIETLSRQRLRGDGLTQTDVHPTSQAFFDLCDDLKEMHRRKSRDYGCPSGEDPLANIRNGAKFVGIPAWKGAMVRLSDKVTRLAAYNATGRLENESLEDNLIDLASYSLLALLLHREGHDA
jgi:hypothetical protein